MSINDSLNLIAARTTAELDRIRRLFRDYQQVVGAPICFTDFESELAGLPGAYAEPKGFFLIAEKKGRDVGCVALRPLAGEPGVAELKRLFVRPNSRKAGLGRVLARAAIERAREAGYQRIQLDTLDSMRAAQRLYLSLGFQILPLPVGHARDHPILMELRL